MFKTDPENDRKRVRLNRNQNQEAAKSLFKIIEF
jgi:hypothetical protein